VRVGLPRTLAFAALWRAHLGSKQGCLGKAWKRPLERVTLATSWVGKGEGPKRANARLRPSDGHFRDDRVLLDLGAAFWRAGPNQHSHQGHERLVRHFPQPDRMRVPVERALPDHSNWTSPSA
jgi:hypothetical protein